MRKNNNQQYGAQRVFDSQVASGGISQQSAIQSAIQAAQSQVRQDFAGGIWQLQIQLQGMRGLGWTPSSPKNALQRLKERYEKKV